MAKKKTKVSEDIQVSKDIIEMMATDEFKSDFSTFLRIKQPLLYSVTNEEDRFLTYLKHYARVNAYEVYTWDCYNGLVDIKTDDIVTEGQDTDLKDPIVILEHILNEARSYVNNLELIEMKQKDNIKG